MFLLAPALAARARASPAPAPTLAVRSSNSGGPKWRAEFAASPVRVRGATQLSRRRRHRLTPFGRVRRPKTAPNLLDAMSPRLTSTWTLVALLSLSSTVTQAWRDFGKSGKSYPLLQVWIRVYIITDIFSYIDHGHIRHSSSTRKTHVNRDLVYSDLGCYKILLSSRLTYRNL